MLAAEKGALFFKSVTDNPNATMCACRRKGMDRTFEAVEGVGLATLDYLKCLVVFIPAGFADCHDTAFLILARFSSKSAAAR